jgi:signal transduction histidine kinase
MTQLLLSAGLVLLLLICLLQWKRNNERNRQLSYIAQKLDEIRSNHTAERVMVMTGDKHLRELLQAINRLLDEQQRMIAHYQRTEMSIKKMLANISHDLKTPLTVILGYAETLLRGQEQVRQQDKLEKVRSKTIDMIDLINKFFDLAKLEAGDQVFDLEKIHVNELCKNHILSYYDLIETEKLKAEIEIPDQPLYILGNEEMLGRILDNLVSNAIRYGREGQVIGFRLYHDESCVYIEVWDRGKGILEKDRDKVFERLYTLEDSRNKLYQGSGLGLTITKRLTERLGGSILLDSQPYQRTSFTVKLKRITW